MSVELEHLLHSTAVAPLESVDVSVIADRAATRRRRQRVAGSAAVAAFGLAIAVGVSVATTQIPKAPPIVDIPHQDIGPVEPDAPLVDGTFEESVDPEPQQLDDDASDDIRAVTSPPAATARLAGPEASNTTPADHESASAPGPAAYRWEFAEGLDGWSPGDGSYVGSGGASVGSADRTAWSWSADGSPGSPGGLRARYSATANDAAWAREPESRQLASSTFQAVPDGASAAVVRLEYDFAAEGVVRRGVALDWTLARGGSDPASGTGQRDGRTAALAPTQGWTSVTHRFAVAGWEEFRVGLARWHAPHPSFSECVGQDRPSACDFGLRLASVSVTFLAE